MFMNFYQWRSTTKGYNNGVATICVLKTLDVDMGDETRPSPSKSRTINVLVLHKHKVTMAHFYDILQ